MDSSRSHQIKCLKGTAFHTNMQWVKSFCEKCGKCIRQCPTSAIPEKPVAKEDNNPTRITYERCCEGFVSYGCGICIKECPFTTSGYDKIKAPFEK